eukprot:6061609-Ditylum_brightwellii.AAC.1
MKDQDALFFYQLLFPRCDVLKPNVSSDPQKNFYTKMKPHGHTWDLEVKSCIDWWEYQASIREALSATKGSSFDYRIRDGNQEPDGSDTNDVFWGRAH